MTRQSIFPGAGLMPRPTFWISGAGADAPVVRITHDVSGASKPSVSTWTVFGVGLRRFLSEPKLCRVFNIAMALALVASLWPIAAEWHG
jgi:hypothetical protein